MITGLEHLLKPAHLWSRSEVLDLKPNPVPATSGIYAWYFSNIPDLVPTDDCHWHDGLVVLYVGIAPSTPSGKSTLRRRIRKHYAGTARVSTLRFSLGCILQDEIGVEFWPKSGRVFLGETEKTLSNRMAENAFVTWMLHPEPWSVERDIIAKLSPPLNQKGNTAHPFHSQLKELRKQAKMQTKARI